MRDYASIYCPSGASHDNGMEVPILVVHRGPAAGGLVYTGCREVRCRAGIVGFLPVGRGMNSGPTPVKVKEGELAGRAAGAMLLLLLLCVMPYLRHAQ